MKRALLVAGACLLALPPAFSARELAQDRRPESWAVKVESPYLKNLWKVDDALYRSEQPDAAAFEYLRDLGIKSVLNLREHHADKALLDGLDLEEYDVQIQAKAFTDAEIVRALRAIAAARKPMVVHCQHGSDRTGVVVAMYRIVFQGWTKEQALAEMRNGGYGFHAKYVNITEYIERADIDLIRAELKESDGRDRSPGGRVPGTCPRLTRTFRSLSKSARVPRLGMGSSGATAPSSNGWAARSPSPG
ncbi:MAG TPA: tyrosine-protein phosphatase [Candidatus Aminicenantes bacterium]|nr:tyrosine-protein phosphatase [Candidatus Aminicenantes bacterium]